MHLTIGIPESAAGIIAAMSCYLLLAKHSVKKGQGHHGIWMLKALLLLLIAQIIGQVAGVLLLFLLASK